MVEWPGSAICAMQRPSPLEGLRAGCAAIHRSGGAMEGEEGARRADEGCLRSDMHRVRGGASHSRLVRSNLSTGEIFPCGRSKHSRPSHFKSVHRTDLPCGTARSPSPCPSAERVRSSLLRQGGGGAGAETPGQGVGEIIIKRRDDVGDKRGGHAASVAPDGIWFQRSIFVERIGWGYGHCPSP